MVKASKLPDSFETGLTELEALIGEIESANLPLDTALQRYQRGTELLRFCEDKLQQAEQQLRVLDGDTLKPFNLDN